MAGQLPDAPTDALFEEVTVSVCVKASIAFIAAAASLENSFLLADGKRVVGVEV